MKAKYIPAWLMTISSVFMLAAAAFETGNWEAAFFSCAAAMFAWMAET